MSKSETRIDIAAIVERIKVAYKLKRNADVARHLGMESRSDPIGKAIKRNSLDLIRVVEKCGDVNQDWLLYGRGEMRVEDEDRPLYPSELGNRGEFTGRVSLPVDRLTGRIVVDGIEFDITGKPVAKSQRKMTPKN